MKNRIPEILGLVCLAIIVLVLCQGCKSARVSGIDDAAKGTQRIHQRFDSIEEAAKQAIPDSGIAKPLVEFIKKLAVGGKVDVKEVDASLNNAQEQVNALQSKYDKLSENNWVKAALWCQRAFWTILITGGVLYIAINAFVAFSPAGGLAAVAAGKNTVRLLSFAGLGAFVRERVLKTKGMPTQ